MVIFAIGKLKNGFRFVVKDSWRIIPMSLAKMPQSLGFGDKAIKEILYYEMFHYQTIDHIKNMTKDGMEFYINKFDDILRKFRKKSHFLNLHHRQEEVF